MWQKPLLCSNSKCQYVFILACLKAVNVKSIQLKSDYAALEFLNKAALTPAIKLQVIIFLKLSAFSFQTTKIAQALLCAIVESIIGPRRLHWTQPQYHFPHDLKSGNIFCFSQSYH